MVYTLLSFAQWAICISSTILADIALHSAFPFPEFTYRNATESKIYKAPFQCRLISKMAHNSTYSCSPSIVWMLSPLDPIDSDPIWILSWAFSSLMKSNKVEFVSTSFQKPCGPPPSWWPYLSPCRLYRSTVCYRLYWFHVLRFFQKFVRDYILQFL